MVNKLLFIVWALLCFWGCKAERVQIPAYINIPGYFVKLSPAKDQGTNNQKFTDMLVFANGQSCGTFPVGSPIPVLSSGATHLLIRGVVEINGVSFLRADYEVMAGCDTMIDLTPGKTTKVIPVFEYFAGVQYPWIEDFEVNPDSGDISGNGGSVQSVYDTFDKTATTYTPGFNSGQCLALKSNADTVAGIRTKNTYLLPAGGIGCYLEFNYLSNVEIDLFITGVQNGVSNDLGGVYPTTGWNKAYINLTEQVSSMNDPKGYFITISTYYYPNAVPNLALIDNIKLVVKQ